jgi:two-component system, NarL family, sensor histidine kinase DegS
LTVATDIAGGLATEQQRIIAEIRELDLLIESTQTEVTRLKAREDQAKTRVEEVRANPSNFQRDEIFGATDEHATSIGRRMTMESQLAALQGKRKLLDRTKVLIGQAQMHVRESATAPMPADAPAVVDEGKLLQAVVDTQEAERKRIARQVHDGPAQAMANVVLQSEISERLFEVDPQRSRTELAALRQMVNKTLQELRGFIFELRPMILDDLGLVPTMRRYVQTLIDKHGVRLDFSSTGRDRRLPSDDEVAIFRLIQDSLIERIEQGHSKDITLGLAWKEDSLEIHLQADGKELPPDGELKSGLRRSERLDLLHGESAHETRPDGTVVLNVRVPIRAAPTIIA